jgi:sphinganine-1-phosphate aldolase
MYRKLTGSTDIRRAILNLIVSGARRIPALNARIELEKSKSLSAIRSSISAPDRAPFKSLPESGETSDALVTRLNVMAAVEKTHYESGNLTGAVYSLDSNLTSVHACAGSLFSKANLLHPDVFVETRQMEAEVVSMTVGLFSGDSSACGCVTTGGTESILLAVKAYRDWGRSDRGITRPNIVVPSTAHAAFVKAGAYFGVEVRRADCDPSYGYEVKVGHMEQLIDGNTVLLVGSSPQYPHGTMDPIPAIAGLAKKWRIGCHVDACLGSYLLDFLRDSLPYKFDFAVDGVTSISCDTHKYAYAPKGSSVLMYSSSKLRSYQYSICSDWEGGLYATPTITGSRCSSTVVGAWASLMYFGREGYAECARKIHAGAKLIERAILDNPILRPELVLMGRTDTSVVSFTTRESSRMNILDIANGMHTDAEMKWSIATLQNPTGLHFAVTMANVENCTEFARDLVHVVTGEQKRIADGGKPGSSEHAVIYGSTASVPPILVDELVTGYLDMCYEIGSYPVDK